MLVLARKIGEKILIGDGVSIVIVDIRPDSVRIGIDAPGLAVDREEVREAKKAIAGRAAELTKP